jgi:hypothetical protein
MGKKEKECRILAYPFLYCLDPEGLWCTQIDGMEVTNDLDVNGIGIVSLNAHISCRYIIEVNARNLKGWISKHATVF